MMDQVRDHRQRDSSASSSCPQCCGYLSYSGITLWWGNRWKRNQQELNPICKRSLRCCPYILSKHKIDDLDHPQAILFSFILLWFILFMLFLTSGRIKKRMKDMDLTTESLNKHRLQSISARKVQKHLELIWQLLRLSLSHSEALREKSMVEKKWSSFSHLQELVEDRRS